MQLLKKHLLAITEILDSIFNHASTPKHIGDMSRVLNVPQTLTPFFTSGQSVIISQSNVLNLCVKFCAIWYRYIYGKDPHANHGNVAPSFRDFKFHNLFYEVLECYEEIFMTIFVISV